MKPQKNFKTIFIALLLAGTLIGYRVLDDAGVKSQ